ncbi:hypothetical protein E3G66_003683 [Mycobacteroides abscessus]|uniref:type VII secretion target n=1 Tax=Mycobacteroides abscessus TaxID=36809 RepID=UPI0009A6560A|nr:type VII secretion target [Mycobacteroides abscessus]OTR15109.1 hypothetical protein B9M80_18480 [Mycobacteroides abscessus]QOF39479.1 hypothetical protein E3G66_003683 [Mycobacteroides abscessus]SLH30108.1 Protein of uncharacterised function (DUF2580) [Mycobacteroides abscessus subsp. abscessus]
MKVDPANVRAGAGKVDGAHADVSKLKAPDSGGAASGLKDFATAGALPAASDAVKTSLTVVAGRYEQMGALLRRSADSYEHQDSKTAVSLTQRVGDGLTSLGDLNAAK